jgi:hypothetical protein
MAAMGQVRVFGSRLIEHNSMHCTGQRQCILQWDGKGDRVNGGTSNREP